MSTRPSKRTSGPRQRRRSHEAARATPTEPTAAGAAAMVDATTPARPAMTDHEHFVAELPRFSAPMDFRNSSAVVDERINQLAATVVERREQQVAAANYLYSVGPMSIEPRPVTTVVATASDQPVDRPLRRPLWGNC